MTINDIKWIMTDHVRYWQTNTDIQMLKYGMGGGEDDGIQGIYATCDRCNPRWVWVSRRARSWHSGDSQYCHRCTLSIVFTIFIEARFISLSFQQGEGPNRGQRPSPNATLFSIDVKIVQHYRRGWSGKMLWTVIFYWCNLKSWTCHHLFLQ